MYGDFLVGELAWLHGLMSTGSGVLLALDPRGHLGV